MGRRRNKQRQPVIGGVVGEDTTKQARKRKAKRDAAEMAKRVRKDLKIPNLEEIRDVERTRS